MKKQNNDTIRAHFIRSVLCVLLLLAVCVIPFALAQSRSRGNTSASAATAVSKSRLAFQTLQQHRRPVERLAGNSQFRHIRNNRRSVLYDQYDNASAIGTLSTAFTDVPVFSSDLADDFVVPTGRNLERPIH